MIPEVSLILCVQGPDHDRLLSRLLSLDTRLVGLDAYEIVLVGHGDPDEDAIVLRRIAEGSPHYRPVLHTHSCGIEEALTTGVQHARGRTIVLLAQPTDDEAKQVLHLLRDPTDMVRRAQSMGNNRGPTLISRESFSPAAARERAPLNAMVRRLAGAFQRWPFMQPKPAPDVRYRSS